MSAVLDPFDHRFAMSAHDPRFHDAVRTFGADAILACTSPPTAEVLAGAWGVQLAKHLPLLTGLRVYETPNCWADWQADWSTL